MNDLPEAVYCLVREMREDRLQRQADLATKKDLLAMEERLTKLIKETIPDGKQLAESLRHANDSLAAAVKANQ